MFEINNIEFYLKVFVAVFGGLVTVSKLRESFASIKRKQEVKLDLEILEKLKPNQSFDNLKIEEKIKINLKKVYQNRSQSLTNFFVGIAVFIGFGFWSIDIYQNSETFNGWIILTLLCSFMGLSMILISDTNNEESDKKGIFYQINLHDKSNYRFGVIILLVTATLTPILYTKSDALNFWQFLSGLFFIIALASIIKNTKGKNKSG